MMGCIAGYNYGTITNCLSDGTIYGVWNVGGLVSCNYGTIESCLNTGDVGNGHWPVFGGTRGNLVARSLRGSKIAQCRNCCVSNDLEEVGFLDDDVIYLPYDHDADLSLQDNCISGEIRW